MKYLYILIACLFLFNSNLISQDYSFRYNPYSGMNKAQLELALKQSQKMELNGKVWTGVGTAMLVGGAIMTFSNISSTGDGESINYAAFGTGLGIMCFSGFPLGYGMIAWIMGSERANMIEIELLASNIETLELKPTDYGLGLVLTF
jgi:hypothetical protein